MGMLMRRHYASLTGSESQEDTVEDINSKTVPELRELAKSKGIDNASKLLKTELLEVLNGQVQSDE
ncbi:Rho termination factor N-terminal domain-containing protein [Lactococcus muris]|uniref:Rho termination factor N-terminal domain-containing protein n=2 Tax=Lactococcus muris TaxID=2941330 RepID=UPI0023008886